MPMINIYIYISFFYLLTLTNLAWSCWMLGMWMIIRSSNYTTTSQSWITQSIHPLLNFSKASTQVDAYFWSIILARINWHILNTSYFTKVTSPHPLEGRCTYRRTFTPRSYAFWPLLSLGWAGFPTHILFFFFLKARRAVMGPAKRGPIWAG